MSSEIGYAYVARKSCGCIAGAVSLNFPKKEISAALAKWSKAGLTIDRVTDDTVRTEFVGAHCPHTAKSAEKLVQLRLFPDDTPQQLSLL